MVQTAPMTTTLVVVFDEDGYVAVYDSLAELETNVEPAMAAEEPYEAFTLEGFVVELSARGNLASNAVTVATLTTRQDLVGLSRCVRGAHPSYRRISTVMDVRTLVNAVWEGDWNRQQRAWWNTFRRKKLPSAPRRL